jgi:hypothetical protein
LRMADATLSSILTLSSMAIKVESMLSCNIPRTMEKEQIQEYCTAPFRRALTMRASALWQCTSTCGGPIMIRRIATAPFVDHTLLYLLNLGLCIVPHTGNCRGKMTANIAELSSLIRGHTITRVTCERTT